MFKIRRMRWEGYGARIEDKRNANNILVGIPKGKRPIRIHKSGWEGNIKLDYREMGWSGMDWIDMARDRDHWRALVNTVVKRWDP
jgi:hypothetical protein